MDKFFFTTEYFRYQLLANHVNGHGVHSPFVYQFILNLLEDERMFYPYEKIEERRSMLCRDKRRIKKNDFGTNGNQKGKQSVATIAKGSLVPRKFGELLFKLVNEYQPLNLLELGTCFGIGSAYLASANSKARLTTIEGCPETAKIARDTFEYLGLKNVLLRIGNFDEILPRELAKTDRLDLVFFDGNHSYKPTMKYFEQCLPKAHYGSVFVFDDIYWSRGMHRAWKEIKKHPKVVLTIDLFFMGIVFFREGIVKQDFVIRF